jgi:uncharacterized protein
VWDLVTSPWPWYVAGPAIGLFVPAFLLLGNQQFGVSSNLRHLCAAIAPAGLEFFGYDWKRRGSRNLAFLAGIVAGSFITGQWLGTGPVRISPDTEAALVGMGVRDFGGLVPSDVFSWTQLLTVRGAVLILGGGFLVGFGTAYAGGCTSGHGISGLAAFDLASLVAVVSFFAGGLFATYVLLPAIL